MFHKTHGRVFGTRLSLTSLPIQAILWIYNFLLNFCQFMHFYPCLLLLLCLFFFLFIFLCFFIQNIIYIFPAFVFKAFQCIKCTWTIFSHLNHQCLPLLSLISIYHWFHIRFSDKHFGTFPWAVSVLEKNEEYIHPKLLHISSSNLS